MVGDVKSVPVYCCVALRVGTCTRWLSAAGTATSNMSASIAHGGIGPSSSAIFRTASHSGSVSLAYLAMPHQSTTHLGSSNSNALSHGESSALNSGDSATLPSATTAGTPLASPNGNGHGNGNGNSSSVTLPIMGMAAVAAAGLQDGASTPAAAAEELAVLRSSPEQRPPVVQLASRQRTVGTAGVADPSMPEERMASSAALSMSPAQARILGTVKEESESREATMETREGAASALLAHGHEYIDEVSEGSSEGMATTLDEIASKMEGMSEKGLDTEGTSTTDGEGLPSSAQLLAESAAGTAAHEGDRLLAQYGNRSDLVQTPAESAVTGLGPSQARRHVFVSPPQGQAGVHAHSGVPAHAHVPPERRDAQDGGGPAGTSTQVWEGQLQGPPVVPQGATQDDGALAGSDSKQDSA